MKNIITIFLFLFSISAQSQELISIGNNGKVTEYTFEEATDYATKNPKEAKELKWFLVSDFDAENIIIQYPLLFEKYILLSGNDKKEVSVDNDSREIQVDNKKGTFYFSTDVSKLYFEFGEKIEFEMVGNGWESTDGKYQLLQSDEIIDESANNEVNTESKIETEIANIRSLTAAQIAKRYLKTKPNETGFSTTMIYTFLGGDKKTISEKEQAEFIFEKINN